MKTYVISLNTPTKLLNILYNYNFKPILSNGVNGKIINLDTIKHHFNSLWFIIGPSSALGCAISHLNVWKQFIKTKQKHCLILEDDVIFETSFSKQKIKQIILNTPKNFDILYLGCFDSPIFTFLMSILSMNKTSLSKKKENTNLVHDTNVSLATHSYILSRKGAKKLIKLLDGTIHNHIDFCIQKLNKNKQIHSYTVNTKIVHQTSTDANYSIEKSISTNIVNSHPILFQNILSKYYIDKHVSLDYIFSVSFIQIGQFTFNLTSIIFVLIGILGIFYKNVHSTLIILIYLFVSLPDILRYNFKSIFLHFLLLISPRLIKNSLT